MVEVNESEQYIQLLKSRLARVREELADAAATGQWRDLAAMANKIAEIEGELHVAELDDRMKRRGVSPERRALSLAEWLSAHQDDEWSGRLNDARRSHQDGRRRASQEIISAELRAAIPAK